MDSSTNRNYQQLPNSGLSRFNSAPSNLLVNFTDSIESGGGNKRSFDSERLISRFLNSGGGVDNSSNLSSGFQEFDVKSPASYGDAQHIGSGLPPHYPRPSSALESSYDLFMDHNSHAKTVNLNLVRQSSSPAGFFAKLSSQNGLGTTKELGNYCGMNGSTGELSPSPKRLKSQISFSSRMPSSLGMLSQISEVESDNSPTHAKVGNGNGYSTGFPYGSWNESSPFAESFTGMKREQGGQNGELGNSVHLLSHHLSLPKTSGEMAAVEKFLQFQDAVPCKIRAKRGCATHPRSIAERVRRTRISERMRKLQELVPNMDKQTNTADMLDLAVEYIKDLQKQFKTLSDSRAKCKCSRIQKPALNQIV